jgi:hypothetical protein
MSTHRIGIMLTNMPKVNISALEYLVLKLNTLQSTFEFEFLPCDLGEDKFIKLLGDHNEIDPDQVCAMSSEFLDRYRDHLRREMGKHDLQGSLPEYYMIVTRALFSDSHYTMIDGKLSIIALGDWEHLMAPPTIYEFCLILILEEAMALISPSFNDRMHFGTKGCIGDFTPDVDDARYFVLNAFLCQSCREALAKDGFDKLADEVTNIIRKDWLGTPDEPNTPANIVKKLGYNLFTTNKLETTIWEKIRNLITEEGVKQLVNIIGVIVLTVLLLWLNLNK